VPQLVEPVVALADVEVLRANAQTAAQPGLDFARQQAKDVQDGGTVAPIQTDCKFRYF
jgi:hypothetical protein